MYQTVRGEVMEKGVAIEAGISAILGFILNIDVENSNSLGHKGSALSFNSKVNLLTDLNFVPKEIARQFQLFAEIRNKFAHVQRVDNFTNCFEILHKHRNYILSTFAKHAPENFDEETRLGMSFTFLCLHLGVWMNVILERSKYLKGQELKKVAVIEMLRAFLANSAPEKGTEEDQKFLEQANLIMNDIEQDKEFMASVAEVAKAAEKHNKIMPPEHEESVEVKES